MGLSEEQMRFVEFHMTTIGYLLANYKTLGKDALAVASNYFYELGKFQGQRVKQKMGVSADDANAVAAVMDAVLEKATGAEVTVRADGDKVIVKGAGFCPMMEAVRLMKAPWDIVCKNISWRWFEGIAAGVNSKATLEVPESRIWGKKCCLHIVTVPK